MAFNPYAAGTVLHDDSFDPNRKENASLRNYCTVAIKKSAQVPSGVAYI